MTLNLPNKAVLLFLPFEGTGSKIFLTFKKIHHVKRPTTLHLCTCPHTFLSPLYFLTFCIISFSHFPRTAGNLLYSAKREKNLEYLPSAGNGERIRKRKCYYSLISTLNRGWEIMEHKSSLEDAWKWERGNIYMKKKQPIFLKTALSA